MLVKFTDMMIEPEAEDVGWIAWRIDTGAWDMPPEGYFTTVLLLMLAGF